MAFNDFEYKGTDMVTYEQKCPLVLVLDVSYSMRGQPISDLNDGLQKFHEEIKSDITASSRLDISIVTFGSDINVVQDFDLVNNFDMPILSVNGSTKLVDGVREGLRILDERKQWYKETGQTYYKPYVVLMTDGYPDPSQNINWLEKEISRQFNGKHLNFWAFGVENADMDLLKKIGHDGSLVQKLKGTEFVKFFKWLSSSITAVTKSQEGEVIDVSPQNEEVNPFQLTIG